MRFSSVSIPVVTVLLALVPPAVAVDYLGGWLPSPPKQQCVDICANSNPKPYCVNATDACLAKKQRPGDFDWMVLEQLFVPQFCRDLLQGVDSTISHQNVKPYPDGIQCQPHAVKSELTIHGLWPNYNDGYAGCCNVTDTIINKPYDAKGFARRHHKLLQQMKTKWVDPTQSNAYDTLCEIYNHEFQKHGLCYHAFGDDMERAAVHYFKTTLCVTDKLASATATINKWAHKGKPTTVAAIKKLYKKNPMVLCSNVPGEGPNKLSVIRTCWEKPARLDADRPFTQFHCNDLAKPTASFKNCDASEPITLSAYTVQASEF